MKQKHIVLALILVLAVIAITTRVFLGLREGGDEDFNTVDSVREVTTFVVGDFSEQRPPLPALGRVQSRSEANVRAEAQGEIVKLYVEAGDFVFAGKVIGEIESSVQYAALTQAEGGVEAAQASLEKARRGIRDEQLAILSTRLSSANSALAEVQVSAVNTIRNTFITADDAIRNKIDPLYKNPREKSPQLSFTISSNSQLEIDLEWNRFLIENMLGEWSVSLEELSESSNPSAFIETAQSNLDVIRVFLDDAALAVNTVQAQGSLTQGTIDTWKANVSFSRTAINGVIASLSALKDNLSGKVAASDIAQKEYDQGFEGLEAEDITASEAALKQARGVLAIAQANLEKAIIRSPISGTLNTLDVELGDSVSILQPIARVSNNNALEVVAFITEEDRVSVRVGQPVRIDSNWDGVVTAIAPALDDKTKKIEITIGLEDAAAELTSGQSIDVAITRFVSRISKSSEFIVPISALKITARDTLVFTVDESGTLVGHAVEVGSIVGDNIVIREGVSADMRIVSDARGLRSGEFVLIGE